MEERMKPWKPMEAMTWSRHAEGLSCTGLHKAGHSSSVAWPLLLLEPPSDLSLGRMLLHTAALYTHLPKQGKAGESRQRETAVHTLWAEHLGYGHLRSNQGQKRGQSVSSGLTASNARDQGSNA